MRQQPVKLKAFELSSHDCSHTTFFISEASSFPNNIPVSFHVCGKKKLWNPVFQPIPGFWIRMHE